MTTEKHETGEGGVRCSAWLGGVPLVEVQQILDALKAADQELCGNPLMSISAQETRRCVKAARKTAYEWLKNKSK